MDRAQVHYEVFVRRKPGSDWTLDMATESRGLALASAEELLAEGRVAAARVTKETLDPETHEFRTVTILNKGAPEKSKARKVREDLEPLCVTPQDLYSLHARDRIGRLLEDWLDRKRATPFELLHRPDLVEQLEASGVELQHAIQKVAVPEAQARGRSVHEMMRSFHRLVERAVERLLSDGRKGLLPDLEAEEFAAAAQRVLPDPDRTYLLGAGVAAVLAPARTWSEKVGLLMDLADAAPIAGPPRALALQTVEQPLAEILGWGVGLEDLLGPDLDLGGRLAAMTRLASIEAVEALMAVEPCVAKVMPPLSEPAQRLGRWLATEDFQDVRAALTRRVLQELNGPRRLRPGDAAGEIDILRGLAMALTAAADAVATLEDVQAAFSVRSRMLITGDFVDAYLGQDRTARQEAEALVWLVENVIGGTNKRNAGRWLAAAVSSLRFEKEVLDSAEPATMRLAGLAALQRATARCGLAPEDYEPIQQKLGQLGGQAEAEAKLVAQLTKAPAPALQRLRVLLRLASGEAAPLGPAAERARAEALRLARTEEIRSELTHAPDQVGEVRELIQQAGLAA